MSDWSGPFPNDDELAAMSGGKRSSIGRHAVMPALDRGMMNASAARRLFGMDLFLLNPNEDRRAPSPITIADLRAAISAIVDGDVRATRPTIEVTAEEWDALRNVEPMDWPRVYGLPMDLGGVHIGLVGIDTVRRRQAEMEELLGD